MRFAWIAREIKKKNKMNLRMNVTKFSKFIFFIVFGRLCNKYSKVIETIVQVFPQNFPFSFLPNFTVCFNL